MPRIASASARDRLVSAIALGASHRAEITPDRVQHLLRMQGLAVEHGGEQHEREHERSQRRGGRLMAEIRPREDGECKRSDERAQDDIERGVGTEKDTGYGNSTDNQQAAAQREDTLPSGELGRDDKRYGAIDERAETGMAARALQRGGGLAGIEPDLYQRGEADA